MRATELMVALSAAIYRGSRYFDTGSQNIEIKRYPTGLRYAEVKRSDGGSYLLVQQDPRRASLAGKLAKNGVAICWVLTPDRDTQHGEFTNEGVINGMYFADMKAEISRISDSQGIGSTTPKVVAP
jgi:hypothetical protein